MGGHTDNRGESMSRSINSELSQHFSSECKTVAMLWKITRNDGIVMGFTNHNEDIDYDSITYNASTGFSPSDIDLKDNFSVDNLDIEGILDSSFITEIDLLNGIYDFSEVMIMLINYNSTQDGVVLLKRGWTGEVKINRDIFVSEVRGLAEKLQRNIGQIYSPSCRAILGDVRCGVDLSAFTISSSVDSVIDLQTFTSNSLTEDDGYFTGGELTWTSGNNNGLNMEIKEFTSSKVSLSLPMPNSMDINDTFDIVSGCDKSFKTCKNKFNNVVNFRGEPHVPGQDKILETAGTRTVSKDG